MIRVSAALCGVAGTGLLLCPLAIAQNTTSPSASDKKFVVAALEGGDAEVQLGQLAAQKGNTTDVKQFGQKMMDDHTKLGDQMKSIAQKEGIKAPARIPAKDKALEAKLRSLSGDAFDKAYIKAMVKDHQQDLAEFKKEADSGNYTTIKDAANQGEQVISQHLELAEDMAKKHNLRVDRTVNDDMNGQPAGHREQEH
jgi:putative membrane protein